MITSFLGALDCVKEQSRMYDVMIYAYTDLIFKYIYVMVAKPGNIFRVDGPKC